MKIFEKFTSQPIPEKHQNTVQKITRCYFSHLDPENMNKYLLRLAPFDKPTHLHIKDDKLYGNGNYLGTIDPDEGQYIIKNIDKIENIRVLSPMLKVTFFEENI